MDPLSPPTPACLPQGLLIVGDRPVRSSILCQKQSRTTLPPYQTELLFTVSSFPEPDPNLSQSLAGFPFSIPSCLAEVSGGAPLPGRGSPLSLPESAEAFTEATGSAATENLCFPQSTFALWLPRDQRDTQTSRARCSHSCSEGGGGHLALNKSCSDSFTEIFPVLGYHNIALSYRLFQILIRKEFCGAL